MKQKIEIEIDVPEGYELESFLPEEMHIEKSLLFSNANSWYSAYVSYRPIEPPLELETGALVHKGELHSDYIYLDKDGKLDIHINSVANNRYIRVSDVIAVLSYYEKTGKLPKVTTKKGGIS